MVAAPAKAAQIAGPELPTIIIADEDRAEDTGTSASEPPASNQAQHHTPTGSDRAAAEPASPPPGGEKEASPADRPSRASSTSPDCTSDRHAPSDAVEATREPARPMSSKPPARRGTPVPPSERRRDDLIGELFEAMHELHFMPDMVSGVDFVLDVLRRMIPSEVILIHVFDINTRDFVVVRAKGPGSHRVVLYRTSDADPLVRRAMARGVSSLVSATSRDEHHPKGRWAQLDCAARVRLFGPVNIGGRYLGLVELANPANSDEYLQSELHALDYICEQLAEFLANRPLVLEGDVILGHG